MTKTSKRVISIITVLFLILLLFFVITFYSVKNTRFSFEEDDYIYIPVGASLNSVIDSLESKFDLDISYKIKIYTKFNSIESTIKPGKHNLSNVVSISDLLKELTTNLNEDIEIQIIEGLRVVDIADQLAENKELEDFESDRFINLCSDQKFIRQLVEDLDFYNVKSLEGFLFPDTYKINPSYNEEDIIKILVSNFLTKIKPYRSDIKDRGIDTLMIVASIIEAETGYENEMKTISSLYYNRIKKNKPLDSDPTFSYLTGRKMKSTDKRSSNPYNTYNKKNDTLILPPTPINSPGLKAIEASIYPEETDYMFMFSPDAVNYHIFTKTNDAHEAVIDSVKANQ